MDKPSKFNPPDFDINKIKFGVDQKTLERALGLYRKGKVTQFEEGIRSYSAIVQSTNNYRVNVEARNFRYAHCTCYIGQNSDSICKHMVAVAIYAAVGGKELNSQDITINYTPTFSGVVSDTTPDQLRGIRQSINDAKRYIKSYNGPSSTWFSYQNSLDEGCVRLATILSEIPANIDTANIVIKLMLSLDKKLQTGGVDDSNGTVGSFIEECVHLLEEFIKVEAECRKPLRLLKGKVTCFGWEEPLLRFIE